MPSDMISNQAMDRMDNCVVHLAWKPPANIDSSDLSHYVIHIDGENVINQSHTVTNNSSLQQFPYPLCTCGDHTVSIQAVSRCGRAGSKTESVRVVPSLLLPLTCDAQATTKNEEIISLHKEVKSMFLHDVSICLHNYYSTFIILFLCFRLHVRYRNCYILMSGTGCSWRHHHCPCVFCGFVC